MCLLHDLKFTVIIHVAPCDALTRLYYLTSQFIADLVFQLDDIAGGIDSVPP